MSAPNPRTRPRWRRALALALTLLVVAAGFTALAGSRDHHGALDPRSADPRGSRAIAELLRERGVTTSVVTSATDARDAAGPDTTLLVAVPDLLTEDRRTALHAATAGSGGRTVLVAPETAVPELVPGVTADPVPAPNSPLEPACSSASARRAGTAETGGIRYDSTRAADDRCYLSAGLPTLLRLPDDPAEPANHVSDAEGTGPAAGTGTASGGDIIVLGAPDILFNERLDRHGNASLALQLLGSRPHLVWYLPTPAEIAEEEEQGILDLLPPGWPWGTLQLLLAACVAALWRARRFGPLVPEALPVAVHAAEAVEGRARLYHKANARDTAGEALRAATRARLAPLLGVPASQADSPESLLPALPESLTDSERSSPGALLFGPPPRDDTALLALADALDALEREVRRP
ncbi:DUF4350 domain-containing protein [Streptomyces sp. ZYX-F-203]